MLTLLDWSSEIRIKEHVQTSTMGSSPDSGSFYNRNNIWLLRILLAQSQIPALCLWVQNINAHRYNLAEQSQEAMQRNRT